MNLAHRVAALLTSLTRGQVAAMSPADRQQLGNECRRVLAMTEDEAGEATAHKAGVLTLRRRGNRAP
jgi:hypothetical protein